MSALVVTCICAFAAAAVLTGYVRRLAILHDVLDVPTARSSHTVATPRGGGVAVVVVVIAAALVQRAAGVIDTPLLLALLGGVAVAAVGFVDDRHAVSPGVRLLLHFAAGVWAVSCLGGLPPLQIGAHTVQLGWIGFCIAVLGVVWTLNLFNFMDGIDGIAASEAVFVALAGATLSAGTQGAVAASAVVFAAAAGGFLLWNWPPARIFMGDVGSGFMGYVISVLALAATKLSPTGAWVWLILGGAFFADATATLARRVLRGRRAHEPHRSHAYQQLARRWGSHRSVTLLLLAVNLLWLAPLAMLAVRRPEWAGILVLVALLPLAALALLCGAGGAEV